MTDFTTAPSAPVSENPFSYDRRERSKALMRQGGSVFNDQQLWDHDHGTPVPYELEQELWAEINAEDERARIEAAVRARDPFGHLYKPGDKFVAPEGRPWAIQDFLIANAMTLLAGKFKNGTSTTSVELAVSLSTGTPMFGLDAFPVLTDPVPVLILQDENADERTHRDIQEILKARGLGHSDHLITVLGRPTPPARVIDLLRQDVFEKLVELVRANGFGYIVIDPIYKYVGDVNISTWDNGPAIIERLTQLRDAGCTPIVTSKIKESGKFDFSSVLGSTVWGAWMETGVLVRRAVNGHDFTFIRDVTRDRAIDSRAAFKLRGSDVGRWELRQATTKPTAEADAKDPTNYQRYLDYVAEEPTLTKAELAKALGVVTRTIERYAEKAAAAK